VSAEPAAAEAPALARTQGAEVELENVVKVYDGRVRAVDGVSLRLERGEFVALAGPSGCGKSTLLNLVGGLDHPDEGEIRVNGQPLRSIGTPEYRRSTIGFVFQLHHLLPALTAGANVEVPLIAAGVPRRERRERARELLGEVGLADRVDHPPAQLSGGERQRVAVARALANSPALLLADEPTGALDSDNSARVLEMLAGLRDRFGMTVLIVSYDPTVGEYADRTIRVLDGRIIGETTTPEPRAGRLV
jgi:ABC-type lipoprotein export system ATPase subunit